MARIPGGQRAATALIAVGATLLLWTATAFACAPPTTTAGSHGHHCPNAATNKDGDCDKDPCQSQEENHDRDGHADAKGCKPCKDQDEATNGHDNDNDNDADTDNGTNQDEDGRDQDDSDKDDCPATAPAPSATPAPTATPRPTAPPTSTPAATPTPGATPKPTPAGGVLGITTTTNTPTGAVQAISTPSTGAAAPLLSSGLGLGLLAIGGSVLATGSRRRDMTDV